MGVIPRCKSENCMSLSLSDITMLIVLMAAWGWQAENYAWKTDKRLVILCGFAHSVCMCVWVFCVFMCACLLDDAGKMFFLYHVMTHYHCALVPTPPILFTFDTTTCDRAASPHTQPPPPLSPLPPQNKVKPGNHFESLFPLNPS